MSDKILPDKPLPETTVLETNRPLNAPSFMRPRRPVLDEPLELDRTKRHAGALEPTDEVPASVPANQAVIVSPPAVDTVPELDDMEEAVSADPAPAETVIVEPEAVAPQLLEEAGPAAEPDPVADMLTSDPEDLQALLEQLQAADLADPAGKRKLSPFQSLIIVLLVVLVILVLAMVFLYASGMIELPPMMMNVIDKGLELVQ